MKKWVVKHSEINQKIFSPVASSWLASLLKILASQFFLVSLSQHQIECMFIAAMVRCNCGRFILTRSYLKPIGSFY